MVNKLKAIPLVIILDKYFGKVVTEKRDKFENELRIDLFGQATKEAQQKLNLTQEQLCQLISDQKA